MANAQSLSEWMGYGGGGLEEWLKGGSKSGGTITRKQIIFGEGSPLKTADQVLEPPPIEEGNTEILRWGSSGTVPRESQSSSTTFNRRGQRPEQKKEEKQEELVFTEKSRTAQIVRVTNPTDASQYVDVERISEIIFTGPNGRDYTFRLNWPQT